VSFAQLRALSRYVFLFPDRASYRLEAVISYSLLLSRDIQTTDRDGQ